MSLHWQHIGYYTDLNGINVDWDSLYDRISESRLSESQFNTAVIEALLMGCPVMYYNPNNEKLPTFLDSMRGHTSTNKKELKETITEVFLNKNEWFIRAERFLDYHVASRGGVGTKVFVKSLKEIINLKQKPAYC